MLGPQWRRSDVRYPLTCRVPLKLQAASVCAHSSGCRAGPCFRVLQPAHKAAAYLAAQHADSSQGVPCAGVLSLAVEDVAATKHLTISSAAFPEQLPTLLPTAASLSIATLQARLLHWRAMLKPQMFVSGLCCAVLMSLLLPLSTSLCCQLAFERQRSCWQPTQYAPAQVCWWDDVGRLHRDKPAAGSRRPYAQELATLTLQGLRLAGSLQRIGTP